MPAAVSARRAGVDQPGRSDKAEAFASPPGVAEAQPQVAVDLLEDQRRAADVLIEVAFDIINAPAALRKGFPQARPPAARRQQQRPAAGVGAVLADLVDGVIREERLFGAAPPGAEPAGGGDEQPVIGAAHQADEEGLERVVVGDAVVRLAQQVHIAALDGFAARRLRGAAKENGPILFLHAVLEWNNVGLTAFDASRNRGVRQPNQPKCGAQTWGWIPSLLL
jgi:hypothetical protein